MIIAVIAQPNGPDVFFFWKLWLFTGAFECVLEYALWDVFEAVFLFAAVFLDE